jgi:hypothetical protein
MAHEPVTIEQVKTHLRLDASADDEDEYLKLLRSAALRSIENHVDRLILDTWPDLDKRDQTVIAQAALLLIGHWYANREAVGKDGGEMPLAVHWLLMPLKKWVC